MNDETQQEQKEPAINQLAVKDRAYLALSAHHDEGKLVELSLKYADVTEIKDKADYRMVMTANIAFKKKRTSIRASGKAARDDARQFAKAVIDEENRLVAIIEPEETRLGDLRKAYEDELERKAEEVRAIEVRRLVDINTRIQAISAQADGLLGADAVSINYRLDAVNTIECTETLFGEFGFRAQEVKAATVATLEQALQMRVEFESQVEANARIAQEQAERQAELDQQAEEQRARDLAAQEEFQAERVRIESIQKRITDIRLSAEGAEGLPAEYIKDRIAAVDNIDLTSDVWQEFANQAEMAITSTKSWLEKALAARLEDDRIDRERHEAEEAERLKAEAARLEALKPDREKLITWARELQAINGPADLDNEDMRVLRDDAQNKIIAVGQHLIDTLSSE